MAGQGLFFFALIALLLVAIIEPELTYYKWMPKLSVSGIDELDKRMLESSTVRNLSATG